MHGGATWNIASSKTVCENISSLSKKESVKLESKLLPEVYFSRVDGLGVDPATLAVDISKTFYSTWELKF